MKILTTTIVTVIALLVAAMVIGRSPDQGSAETGQGKLAWVSFDEGTALAKEQNKKVLVDIYTDWCGWCKKMDSNVYTNAEVMKVIKAKYIPVKLNAESSKQLMFDGSQLTETQFARAVGVTGYPTTLFLHADAKPITLLPGYVPADRFANVLNYIGNDHFKSMSFQEYLTQLKPPQ